MPHLREEADADRIENIASITDFETGPNKYKLFCGSCGKLVFVDHGTSDGFNRAIEHDMDNQFLCDSCRQEDDELAYAAR